MQTPLVSIVAAIGKHRELGKKNELLWLIPDDLKRFKELTFGHPVIMGRKTFESIMDVIGKPLPGRTNIVITRDASYRPVYQGQTSVKSVDNCQGQTLGDNVICFLSIEEGIAKAKELDASEIFVIGGGQIYASALPYVDKLYLTIIDDTKEADTFFPEYEEIFTKKTFEETRDSNGLNYRWVNLERE